MKLITEKLIESGGFKKLDPYIFIKETKIGTVIHLKCTKCGRFNPEKKFRSRPAKIEWKCLFCDCSHSYTIPAPRIKLIKKEVV